MGGDVESIKVLIKPINAIILNVADDHVVKLFENEDWKEVKQLVLNGYFEQMPDVAEKLGNRMTDNIRGVLERLMDMQVRRTSSI